MGAPLFVAALGRAPDPAQLEQLRRYVRLLLTASARLNLTAVQDPAAVEQRHVAESLALVRLLEQVNLLPAGGALIDVGSGGGLPGLPVAIVRPDLRVTLLDATGKKVAFLRETAAALGLGNVTPLHARAEDAGRDAAWRERFDVATARAVAPLATLVELLLPFVAVGGVAAAVKGARAAEEVATATGAIARCGGRLSRVASRGIGEPGVPQPPPNGGAAPETPGAAVAAADGRWDRDGLRVPTGGGEALTVVLIAKVAPTPPDLPRRAGVPAKRPLR
ncbi:MAG: 16S rRNA (guanine(527)-N(7))-methyltransferase RsmG [Dehalococcoidia bacterium]